MSDTDELPTREIPSGVPPRAALPKIPDITIERMIGSGGMGSVYLGHQSYLDRRVAVKILAMSRRGDAERYMKRFQREAKLLASLAHPNIVGCFNAGVTPEGDCFLAMEFIEGPDLKNWVQKQGALPERAAIELTRNVARALEYAHARGIIHRDVKPENILLQKNESAPPDESFPFIPKLADLGLALPIDNADQSRLTAEGVVVGTPATMAPEQMNDPENVDFRADIYGLGCAFYHALTGERPFPQKTMTEIFALKSQGYVPDPLRAAKGKVSAGAARLAQWMLAPDAEDRPQSYAELIAQCDTLLGGGSAQIPTLSIPTSSAGPKFGKGLILGTGLGAVALAAAAMVFLRPSAREAESSSPARNPQTEQPARPSTHTAPLIPANVKFDSKAEPLFGVTPMEALAGWGEKVGSANWTGNEEGEGVFGSDGVGRISYSKIGSPPWRIEGTLAVNDQEAGVRVELKSGGAIAFSAQNLNSTWVVGLIRFEDLANGEFTRAATYQSRSFPPPRGGFKFSLTATATQLELEIEGERMIAPITDEISAISLYVKNRPGQKAHFEDLAVRRAS
ncbi:serine/threonine protein kinase [Candidatus Sumerlaeota bacterium]|nr:serine/threonine protein kinase [Candidatus Sumerlaeota bacterium]